MGFLDIFKRAKQGGKQNDYRYWPGERFFRSLYQQFYNKTNSDITVTSEKGSKVLASVKAGNAVISGSIKGNVKVIDRLEVTSSAQIIGDIDCKVLVVEAGALLKGKVSMKVGDIESPKQDKKAGIIRGITKDSDKK